MNKQLFFYPFLIVLLTSCGTMQSIGDYLTGDDDDADPPAPLVNFKQQLNIIELWSKRIGRGLDEHYLKLAPILANQRLFVADIEGTIKAMDATNGQSIWSTRLASKKMLNRFWFRDYESSKITGGPGYGENTVLVGTNNGEIIAYAAESGDEMWRTTVSSEVLSPPQKENDVVIVRSGDGKIFALGGMSGKLLWIYDRTVPTLTLRGTGTPIITDNIVVAGFDEGRLAALELKTGRLMWETRITTAHGSSELERMVDIDSTPVVIEGVIYVVTFQGHLAAVLLETGRILWTRDISSYAGISVDAKNVYISDENSHILALDRFSGSEVWEQDKLHARRITAPASIDNYIVVGDFEGYLHWMHKASGRFVARSSTVDEPIIAPPIVAGKFLYVYCSDGTLIAYSYR